MAVLVYDDTLTGIRYTTLLDATTRDLTPHDQCLEFPTKLMLPTHGTRSQLDFVVHQVRPITLNCCVESPNRERSASTFTSNNTRDELSELPAPSHATSLTMDTDITEEAFLSSGS